MGMKQRGGSEIARRNQHVIIGPWTHMNFSGSFPEREFGPNASSAAIDLPGLHLRWFDRWLKDEDNGIDKEPYAVYEIRLNLWATAKVFLPGHRIRLEVSSSNFPRFDRNSNTGGDIINETADQYQPAINCIFHDATHPSRLILPLISR